MHADGALVTGASDKHSSFEVRTNACKVPILVAPTAFLTMGYLGMWLQLLYCTTYDIKIPLVCRQRRAIPAFAEEGCSWYDLHFLTQLSGHPHRNIIR